MLRKFSEYLAQPESNMSFADLLDKRNEFEPRARNLKGLEDIATKYIPEECEELLSAIQNVRKACTASQRRMLYDPDWYAQFTEQSAEIVDGLIDIIYFALGGLVGLGQNHQLLADCFMHVHEANMRKIPNPESDKLCDKGPEFVRPNEEIEKLLDIPAMLRALGLL